MFQLLFLATRSTKESSLIGLNYILLCLNNSSQIDKYSGFCTTMRSPILGRVGETGAKSNRGEMQQSQYLAQVMSLGSVIHDVVVQFDNPPFHPKMAGEMLSYRIFSSQKTSFDIQK